jgi:pyruvate dehydrogenase E1 component
MTDEQIDRLRRGGHDLVKIYAAYAAAASHAGQPTVILAHTKKGYGMGSAGQGRMTTHSHKKLGETDLIEFRNRFGLPVTDEQVRRLDFYKPAQDSAEMQYLYARRSELGGYLPARQTSAASLAAPMLSVYGQFAVNADGKEMSTTMALVRMLGGLLKDKELGPRIVPIVADEARTFGMANLFRQVGIYSSVGQRYEPEDIGSILSYREALDGQILEEGISEAGAVSSWMAAGTSYSVHGTAMLPFYIYYSMFGFQRVGDLIWAAADQRPRGFLIGATSGRTTLGGEGLQHQDGTSHVLAAAIPNCKSYDPAFAGELAVIVDQGIQEMVVQQKDVFYYITVMNENYAQPSLLESARADIIRGGYIFESYAAISSANETVNESIVEEADKSAHNSANRSMKEDKRVTLLGSGAILREVIMAAQQLAQHGIASDVLSITSWSELARDGQQCEAEGRQGHIVSQPFIATQLSQTAGPIVAASDYVRMVPESIRAFVPPERRYITLGTDGFGRSDTRAELRHFFEVDATAIVNAALYALRCAHVCGDGQARQID